MAIQNRRGNEADYNPSRMLAGEYGFSLDKQRVHASFGPGQEKTILFKEDLINDVREIAKLAIDEAQSWAHGDSHVTYTVNDDGDVLMPTQIVDTTEDNAKFYKEQAELSANQSSNSASESLEQATHSAQSAEQSLENATISTTQALISEGYTQGTQNGEAVDSTSEYYHNNSKYYKEQAEYYEDLARRTANSIVGALKPMGTVAFEDLPSVADAGVGDMYNISNSFTTTNDFTVGAGIDYPRGSNVYKLGGAVAQWDVLVGGQVMGVKGDAEANYRSGNVNLTPENIGVTKQYVSGLLTPSDIGITKQYLVNMIYPIGSIYISVNSTSPATLFGGTWVQLKDRFLIGCGGSYSAGSTGGTSTINIAHSHSTEPSTTGSHALTENEMPQHSHEQVIGAYAPGAANPGQRIDYNSDGECASFPQGLNTYPAGGGQGHTHTIPNIDTDVALTKPISVLNPYLAVYMWKRTA